jgi:hypothetical protein
VVVRGAHQDHRVRRSDQCHRLRLGYPRLTFRCRRVSLMRQSLLASPRVAGDF